MFVAWLMGMVDRRVDRDDPPDPPSGVSGGEQGLQDPVPGPIDGVAAVSLPYRLPGAEVFGQVTPGNPGAVPVKHPVEDLTGVFRNGSPLPSSPVIGELLVAVGGGHDPGVTGHSHH